MSNHSQNPIASQTYKRSSICLFCCYQWRVDHVGIGTFTNAIDNILSFYDTHLEPLAGSDDALLNIFATPLSDNLVAFSFSNPSSSRSLEIALIKAVPVERLNSCPICSYQARIPVSLTLGPSDTTYKKSHAHFSDPYKLTTIVIFGTEGTYKLGPKESAPFAISITGDRDYGLLFSLQVHVNDTAKEQRVTFVPDYYFYYLGRPMFEPHFLVFKFDQWSDIEDDYAREYIAGFFRGDRKELTRVANVNQSGFSRY